MPKARSPRDIILGIALLGVFVALFVGFHEPEIGCVYLIIVTELVLMVTDINVSDVQEPPMNPRESRGLSEALCKQLARFAFRSRFSV